jgi:hypothetical protein
MKHAAPDVLGPSPKSRTVKQYDTFGIREKQYLAIADTAAHEFESLRDVRAALSKAFRYATDELRSRDGEDASPDSSLYWFVAKRAYVVEVTLADSTRVLSHLHDKIAQMLDTTSGSMPHPLSLRRWQSANHEKFLSAYCRDLCVDTAKAMAFLNIPAFDPDSCAGSDRKTYEKRSTMRWKQTVVSHIWNHSATSETIPLIKGEIATENSAEAGTPAGYALIRSLYFYLEHPILFPLLFHELGHIHIELDQQEEGQLKAAWGNTPRDAELFAFLRSSRKAAKDLKIGMARLSIYTIADEDFHLIATEIWADALGVVLGGASFVHALALQIFGQREHRNIAKGRRSSTSPSDGDSVGDHGYDIWHQQLRTPNDSEAGEKPAQYFSFARTLVAVRLARALYERAERTKDLSSDAEDLPFMDALRDSCDAIEELWKRFRSSGEHAYNKDRSSGDHKRWWDVYCDANESLAEGCFVHLEAHIGRMWQYAKDHNRHAYRFGRGPTDKELRKRIWQFFEGFVQQQDSCDSIKNRPVHKDLMDRAPTRLEDAALAIRWASAMLLFDQATSSTQTMEHDSRDRFIELDNFVDKTLWDGLGAFRYLLEWYQLVMAEGHSLGRDSLCRLAKNLLGLFSETESSEGLSDGKCLKSLLETKFMIFFLNPRYEWWEKVDSSEGGGDRLGWIGSDADKRDLFEKYTSEFIENLKNELWQRGFEKIGKDDGFPVSVLCLGVLRPSSSIEHQNGQVSLVKKTAQEALTSLTVAIVMGTKMNSPVFPAIGEYSYVRLEPERTVSNLDTLAESKLPPRARSGEQGLPALVPRHFEKPRMLVKVFGKNNLLGVKNAENDDDKNGFSEEQFVRLALIKFQHRSKWLDLLGLLTGLRAQDAEVKCALYLSSGWEDVVLLVLHDDMSELCRLSQNPEDNNLYGKLNNFLNVKANELDVQSMLVTQMPSLGEPTEGTPKPLDCPTQETEGASLVALCEGIRAYATLRLERSSPKKVRGEDWDVTAELTFGRYDGRLKWTGVTPKEFQDIFLTLPANCYHQLQHLAHGVGWNIPPSPIDDPQASERNPFLFTRIDLTIH